MMVDACIYCKMFTTVRLGNTSLTARNYHFVVVTVFFLRSLGLSFLPSVQVGDACQAKCPLPQQNPILARILHSYFINKAREETQCWMPLTADSDYTRLTLTEGCVGVWGNQGVR